MSTVLKEILKDINMGVALTNAKGVEDRRCRFEQVK